MLSANGGQINTAIRSSHAFTHKNKRYCLITIREPSSPFPLISSMAYTGNEIKLVYLHDNGERITPYRRSLTNCEMQGTPIKVTLRVRYCSDERLDFSN
jgi:hypothetical protein